MAFPYSEEIAYDSTGINKEIDVCNSDTLNIECTGTGSCVLQGKMTKNSNYKDITAINTNGYDMKKIIDTDDIWVADVSGLYQIRFINITGFTKIQVRLS